MPALLGQTRIAGTAMTIVRFEPGEEAPGDARYLLVGHYGEPSGLVVRCDAGEPLPQPPPELRAALKGPYCYVRDEEELETWLAA